MRTKPIEVKVTFTEGYRERFTKACILVAERREQKEAEKLEIAPAQSK